MDDGAPWCSVKGGRMKADPKKIKGICEMVAGAAVVSIGVPLCILPGPGLVVVVGGVALISKGRRDYTARAPTKIEEKLDAVAARAAAMMRQEAVKAGKAAMRGTRRLVSRALQRVARAPQAGHAKTAERVTDQ